MKRGKPIIIIFFINAINQMWKLESLSSHVIAAGTHFVH